MVWYQPVLPSMLSALLLIRSVNFWPWTHQKHLNLPEHQGITHCAHLTIAHLKPTITPQAAAGLLENMVRRPLQLVV
jgi:hypothetical protein